MTLRRWLGELREPAVLVAVVETRGSTPREVGAAMLVTATGQRGSIGGGELEWRATALARGRIGTTKTEVVALPLGPELGQCCGGFVRLAVRPVEPGTVPDDLPAEPRPPPVWLFGAGHVGRAVVEVLSRLPGQHVVWIDERPDVLPSPTDSLTVVPAATPEVLVAKAPAGARLLVMTHSHGRDLAIVAAALARRDLGFLGMIGSRTKRSRFEQRLRALDIADADLALLTCPIGRLSIPGKDPATIAVAVAAQLLELPSHG